MTENVNEGRMKGVGILLAEEMNRIDLYASSDPIKKSLAIFKHPSPAFNLLSAAASVYSLWLCTGRPDHAQCTLHHFSCHN